MPSHPVANIRANAIHFPQRLFSRIEETSKSHFYLLLILDSHVPFSAAEMCLDGLVESLFVNCDLPHTEKIGL